MRYCVSTMLAILIGTVSPAWCYEVIAVSDGGTLTGTVRLEGQIPKPKGYNLTTLPDPLLRAHFRWARLAHSSTVQHRAKRQVPRRGGLSRGSQERETL